MRTGNHASPRCSLQPMPTPQYLSRGPRCVSPVVLKRGQELLTRASCVRGSRVDRGPVVALDEAGWTDAGGDCDVKLQRAVRRALLGDGGAGGTDGGPSPHRRGGHPGRLRQGAPGLAPGRAPGVLPTSGGCSTAADRSCAAARSAVGTFTRPARSLPTARPKGLSTCWLNWSPAGGAPWCCASMAGCRSGTSRTRCRLHPGR